MNLQDYDDQDGRKVWLSEDEVNQLLNVAEDTYQRIAFVLGARCGLRSDETVRVAP